VAEDPEDPERRILAQNKQNLCKPAASLAFTLETASNGAARIAWRGRSELSAGQILQAPADEEEKSALSEAKEFLRGELEDGPMGAKQVKKNAREADVSERTLKRAKQALRVKSEKESDGSWTWSLPIPETQGSQPSNLGPLGTVGPLAHASGAEDPYLSEGGQGGQEGQEGQGLEMGEDWPPWQDELPRHREDCLCEECLPI
jgi:putative DNA primase/helicase